MALAQSDKQYLTSEGDELDLICWRHYGRTQDVVEVVLRRNRGLFSTYGAILPAGLIMILPVVNVPIAGSIKLWNYRPLKLYPPVTVMRKDTISEVDAALAAYRAGRSGSLSATTINVGNVWRIGERTRIRDTGKGSVVEILGDDNIWRVQQEWAK